MDPGFGFGFPTYLVWTETNKRKPFNNKEMPIRFLPRFHPCVSHLDRNEYRRVSNGPKLLSCKALAGKKDLRFSFSFPPRGIGCLEAAQSFCTG